MFFIAETPKIIKLRVPTLNDKKADFNRMFGLWQEIRGIDTPKVIFDFSGCRFLRANAVAFLGGLARLIECRGGQAFFLIKSEETLLWAFKLGTTTRSGVIPGGTGLDSLKNFVKSKQGKIEVYSHDAYALIDRNREIYETTLTFFEGTLINITIQCEVNHHNFTENGLFL
jgi:hypothetical protein